MMRYAAKQPLRLWIASLILVATAWPLAGCSLRRSVAADTALSQTLDAGEAVASDRVAKRDPEPPASGPSIPAASVTEKPSYVATERALPTVAPVETRHERRSLPVTAVALESTRPALPSPETAAPGSRRFGTVIHGDQATFDQHVLQSESPVLVDFYADWCGPCKTMAPTLAQVAAENPGAKVVKVNVDQNPELAARYGIKSLPSLIVFKDGRIVAKEKGVVSKGRLIAMLDL